MAKRTRWQPPHPDPNKGQPKRPGDDKPRGWRMPAVKRPRCKIIGCSDEASPEAATTRIPLCADHISMVRAAYTGNRGFTTRCLNCEDQAEKTADQAERRNPDYVGKVYYLLTGDTIKIGWSSDIGKRMRQYPPNSTLLATEDGPRSLEKSRHGLFNEYLVQGREWFAQGEHLMAWIEQIRERNGVPAQIQQQRPAVEAPRGRPVIKTRHSQWKGREHDGSAAIKRPSHEQVI